MTNSSVLTLSFFVLLLMSCGQKPVVEAELINSDGFWSQEDLLEMDFNISDTTEIYNLTVTIDHTRDYTWENLYVKIHNLFPDGDTLSREVSLDLANKKGEWQGDCSAATCRAVIDLQSSFFFPQKGDYRIWVEQYMRVFNLEHVHRVHLGLYLNKMD